MLHFGRRVIGDEAFKQSEIDHEEGREHFGPRVIGGDKPYKESAHGPKVVGEKEAELQQQTIKAAGAPKALDDLKIGELERICDQLEIKYKKKSPKPVLIKRIRDAYAERGAVPPQAATVQLTDTEELAPDEPTIEQEKAEEEQAEETQLAPDIEAGIGADPMPPLDQEKSAEE